MLSLTHSRDPTPHTHAHSHPAVLAGIESCCGVKAKVLGKPSEWLAKHIIETKGLDPSRTCMVGDRLDSDMLFGHVSMSKCESERQRACRHSKRRVPQIRHRRVALASPPISVTPQICSIFLGVMELAGSCHSLPPVLCRRAE